MPEWTVPRTPWVAPSYATPVAPAASCGRACGQPWTDEDFAAAEREIARLTRDIEALRSMPSIYQVAPIYQPPPNRYNFTAPSYSVPIYERRSGTTTDPQSGNVYNWRKDSRGNTHVDGMNLYNGSMWQTDIKPNGSMTGTDKNFNYWNYDAKSKTYMNLGTGELCIGEGYARVCTGGK
jgi:hypothetical protein